MKTKFSFQFLVAMVAGIFMSVSVFAQDLPVTGTVIDDFGEPVLGANVVIKGTANGATTDLDGNFSFRAPKGSTIVISFIGYKAAGGFRTPRRRGSHRLRCSSQERLDGLGYRNETR